MHGSRQTNSIFHPYSSLYVSKPTVKCVHCDEVRHEVREQDVACRHHTTRMLINIKSACHHVHIIVVFIFKKGESVRKTVILQLLNFFVKLLCFTLWTDVHSVVRSVGLVNP